MQVSVCNMRDSDFNSKFVNSLLTTGFAVITHHDIDHGLIREVQAAWRNFFTTSQDYKNTFVNVQDSNMGYTGFGGEKAVGAERADLKEFFHWKPGQVMPSEVSALTEKLFNLLEGHVADQLLQALNGVGSNMNYREVCQNSNNTVLRALYYPALTYFQEGAMRSFPHEDINFLTLLVAASAPGLQVQDRDGEWHDVPYEQNSLIVNAGDMLQLASNYTIKSTTHRVVNNGCLEERISLPLFIHPHGDTMLAPGYTAQQYLNERLNTIYKNGYQK